MKETEKRIIAEHLRNACIDAAKEGFRDASVSGLCRAGAMEAAISAMQRLDIEKILRDLLNQEKP